MLNVWLKKVKCTKKELQKLIGKLNWCARVVRGGRTFMRCLINLMIRIKKSHFHIRISREARGDLEWWTEGLRRFHGLTPFISDLPVPAYVFGTDACELAGGAHFAEDWMFVSWKEDAPSMVGRHINVLELQTVLMAAQRWGPRWAGLHVKVRSDNMATVASINKTTSRSAELLVLIREIFWLSVQFNFKLTASFIPGVQNVLADRISRLYSRELAVEAQRMLGGGDSMTLCTGHMSHAAFSSLQMSWRRDCPN